jgi:hypothetical protein
LRSKGDSIADCFTRFLRFKGRIKVGMGLLEAGIPILTPALSMKEREFDVG